MNFAQMLLQVKVSAESFVAELSSKVKPKQYFTTHFARIWLLLLMGVHVELQVVGVVEGLWNDGKIAHRKDGIFPTTFPQTSHL